MKSTEFNTSKRLYIEGESAQKSRYLELLVQLGHTIKEATEHTEDAPPRSRGIVGRRKKGFIRCAATPACPVFLAFDTRPKKLPYRLFVLLKCPIDQSVFFFQSRDLLDGHRRASLSERSIAREVSQ